MTIYERKMTIKMSAEEWNDSKHLEEMIQGDLHWLGLSQVASYYYGNEDNLDSTQYGFNWIEKKNSQYEILIGGKEAFTLEYSSEARLAVKGLIASGYDADSRRIISAKSFEGWVEVHGRFFVATFNSMEGEYSRHHGKGPAIEYENGVTLITQFYRSYNEFTIDFTITFETDDLTVKNKAEEMLVDTPLNDMRYIKRVITKTLKDYVEEGELEVTEIDCESRVISSANYECSQESIGKVMDDE
tara:strand:+ start:115 stop:846 length:732 start_codon:yes stop_codon:yes gene_type:complete